MSIRQIAKKSGYSPAAVSMALRNSPSISAATKRRIRRCAELLNYRPDAKVSELMGRLRTSRQARSAACLAVVSLYDSPRPWERSGHFTRIYQGMMQRAADLGYRLDPIWLRAPGMTLRRFRSILDVRGIEGLVCFGSPDVGAEFPPELDHYAVVTVGASIKTPLHRVTSHMFSDMTLLLDEVYRRGYRRPGLVLGRDTDVRSQHLYLSAFLGWCDYTLGGAPPVPVLRLRGIEAEALRPWQRQHQPDVLVFAHTGIALKKVTEAVRELGVKVPDQIGVVIVAQILEGTGYAGTQPNQLVMGARAIELLVDRIMNHDLGISTNPRIELVESQWIDGGSLLPPAEVRPRRLLPALAV